jgi:hypothetical protein
MSEAPNKFPKAAALVWLALLNLAAEAGLQFSDITIPAGVEHEYVQPEWPPPENTLEGSIDLEYKRMTGGAVAEDFDGDGWIDLYVLQGGLTANLLYINQQNGTFAESASARGADHTGLYAGVAAADFDSDGDVDIFISSKDSPHLLLINDGAGFFTTNTTWFTEPTAYATSPSWGDINNDGLLDLALGPWAFEYENIWVMENNGAGFTLSQVLFKTSVFTPVFADLNGDRFQDLVGVADFGQTSWYFNNQSGIFLPAGSSDVENGMGSAVGDIDNDGDLDLFITSIRDLDGAQSNWGTTGNRLLLNNGAGAFTDITESAGVRDGYWGWGATFGDFDNDGDLDLYHVNGWSEDGLLAPAEFNNTPARLFENLGGNVFNEVAAVAGAADTGQGRCVVSFDYDNDGDLDLFIANHLALVDLGGGQYELQPGAPKLLRNDTVTAGRWLKVHLSGTGAPHHSHGIGSRVYVETGGLTQMRELNASSGFNGHGPNRIAHFGLAAHETADRIRAAWTNGDQTMAYNVAADQTITLTSPAATVSTRVVLPGEAITASYSTEGLPEAEVVWTVGGSTFSNPVVLTFDTPGIHTLRVDIYADSSRSVLLRTEIIEITVLGTLEEDRSIARIWNEEILGAIRIDFPNPAVHARNLFHLSIAMWDAWAAYDADAEGYIYHTKETAADVSAARHEAISYAAYRILSARYASSVNASTTQALLDLRMDQLGLDRGNVSTSGTDPAAVGNRIAEAILAWSANDGSREAEGYADPSYVPVNDPLDLLDSGTTLLDPNRWQPLEFEEAQTQNGQVTSNIQIFQGSHWGDVRPFAMLRQANDPYLDPGWPPLWGAESEADYIAGNVEVIRHSSWLDPDDGTVIDISPLSRGRNTLGTNDGTGHGALPNPATGQPYASNPVKRGDYGRVLAEYWADGPNSETPPGHWNKLANLVADHPDLLRKFRGEGLELEQLEWDVKVYFALNAALHDAAIAAWGAKRYYDYIRPISSIRFLGLAGQLPEVAGLIETITVESSAPGERHYDLVSAGASIGETAIYAWGGEPLNPENEYTGRQWILAADWMPYQKDTFVTPAFAVYVSGHSAFSRAGAEVLTYMTGSEYFPGGLASHTAPAGSLEFELGPSEAVTLQWARYYDAADEAGLSRLFGGIHVPADDGPGRIMGSTAGQGAVELAQRYFDGSVLNDLRRVELAIGTGTFELTWAGVPGLYFQVQSSPDLIIWSDVGPRELMLENRVTVAVDQQANPLFFRVVFFEEASP